MMNVLNKQGKYYTLEGDPKGAYPFRLMADVARKSSTEKISEISPGKWSMRYGENVIAKLTPRFSTEETSHIEFIREDGKTTEPGSGNLYYVFMNMRMYSASLLNGTMTSTSVDMASCVKSYCDNGGDISTMECYLVEAPSAGNDFIIDIDLIWENETKKDIPDNEFYKGKFIDGNLFLQEPLYVKIRQKGATSNSPNSLCMNLGVSCLSSANIGVDALNYAELLFEAIGEGESEQNITFRIYYNLSNSKVYGPDPYLKLYTNSTQGFYPSLDTYANSPDSQSSPYWATPQATNYDVIERVIGVLSTDGMTLDTLISNGEFSKYSLNKNGKYVYYRRLTPGGAYIGAILSYNGTDWVEADMDVYKKYHVLDHSNGVDRYYMSGGALYKTTTGKYYNYISKEMYGDQTYTLVHPPIQEEDPHNSYSPTRNPLEYYMGPSYIDDRYEKEMLLYRISVEISLGYYIQEEGPEDRVKFSKIDYYSLVRAMNGNYNDGYETIKYFGSYGYIGNKKLTYYGPCKTGIDTSSVEPGNITWLPITVYRGFPYASYENFINFYNYRDRSYNCPIPSIAQIETNHYRCNEYIYRNNDYIYLRGANTSLSITDNGASDYGLAVVAENNGSIVFDFGNTTKNNNSNAKKRVLVSCKNPSTVLGSIISYDIVHRGKDVIKKISINTTYSESILENGALDIIDYAKDVSGAVIYFINNANNYSQCTLISAVPNTVSTSHLDVSSSPSISNYLGGYVVINGVAHEVQSVADISGGKRITLANVMKISKYILPVGTVFDFYYCAREKNVHVGYSSTANISPSDDIILSVVNSKRVSIKDVFYCSISALGATSPSVNDEIVIFRKTGTIPNIVYKAIPSERGVRGTESKSYTEIGKIFMREFSDVGEGVRNSLASYSGVFKKNVILTTDSTEKDKANSKLMFVAETIWGIE